MYTAPPTAPSTTCGNKNCLDPVNAALVTEMSLPGLRVTSVPTTFALEVLEATLIQ